MTSPKKKQAKSDATSGTRKKPGKNKSQPASPSQTHVTAHLKIPLNFDPSSTSIRFSKLGMGWALKEMHFQGLPTRPDEGKAALDSLLEAIQNETDNILKRSELLKHLDLDDDANADEAIAILKKHDTAAEWWAFLSATFAGVAKEAIETNDTRLGIWAATCMSAARSMLIFKRSIEKSLWQGYRVALNRETLNHWTKNKQNANEEFWQQTISEHTLVLSQLFSFPVILFKSKAYVGGKGIENTGGKVLDYLVMNDLTRNTALVEIKTPRTLLLDATAYRSGVYPISSELSGAINQVLTYKNGLQTDYLSLKENSGEPFTTFNPQCLVIAGNVAEELKTREQLRSFELFRNSLKDVQVIGYDEVFAKIEALLKLLGV